VNIAIVTGATGFIGTRLCEQLVACGWQVRATARANSQTTALANLGAEIVRCDLSREGLPTAALEDVQTVFHLAGMTTSSRLDELRSVNAAGTRRLAESLTGAGVSPTVVHVSSIAASGPAANGKPRTPGDSPLPISNYGRSKLEGEQAIATLADDMPVSIVRPSVVFGPGDREGFRIVEPIAKLGLHFSPGWRSPRLSVIYVDDLVEILMRTAERGRRISRQAVSLPAGEGIYVATVQEHPTYREWGTMIAAALDRRVRVLPVPPRIAKVVGWCAEQIGSGALHRDKIREALVETWAYDDENLTKELDIQPSHSLAEQLSQTIAWYRAEGWLKQPAG